MDYLNFGKYKSVPIAQVPVEYLKWAYDTLGSCPPVVVRELSRRGVMTGQQWLSQKESSIARKQEKRLARRQSRQAQKELFAEIQRQSAASRLAEMKSGILIEGSDYQRLRDEFDRAGGDPDDCPFDAADYQYTGPSMVGVGGKTVIVPSEFPQEVK